jgi:hypothetical protein
MMDARGTAPRPAQAAADGSDLRHTAVALCPDAILIHTDGRIRYANTAAVGLFGGL